MRCVALFLLACAGFGQTVTPAVTNARFETRPYSGDLTADVRAVPPTWFGYSVKSVSHEHENCCYDGSSGCWLEERKPATISSVRPHSPIPLEGSDPLAVLFRVADNNIEKIRVFSLSCPLDAGGLPFVWLSNVPARSSIDFLHKLVVSPTEHPASSAIFAIAQHDDAYADTVLEQFTRPDEAESIREKTVFWLGASRGAWGASLLKSIVTTDASERVRDKAVFALSISKQPEATQFLIDAAKTDPSAHVRGQALFWLAQKAGKEASTTIKDAIENDPDTSVKKKAVFALSQLPKDDGVPKLIEVAKTQRNPEVRKQAFFWLGQSHDPRALAFIEQVLTK
jgi:HEAT repeat protein